MPKPSRAKCQVCNETESKYTCSVCSIVYCSVPCYKQHKGIIPLQDEKPLKALTSLRWPYVPEESAYPDPLTRDDPKPLSLPQYEAIATSKPLRALMTEHPELRDTLKGIDELRGQGRVDALHRALRLNQANNGGRTEEVGEDVLLLRQFAQAVEDAIRGDKQDGLRLQWGE
ncbi:hypothetical protein BD626DRAFT_398952 [Schizophyllum amplum]|uniref:HIT-type domain-containing protein n=1 Tax=Schizophyllum amplum TaxID=97359 RepID=A0A550CLC1_9AGAR|nr:hypothetical protein BD626DRAFT_398952 [Auriculariopsis ampla]